MMITLQIEVLEAMQKLIKNKIVSKDESRPFSTGIHCVFTKDLIKIEATTGHILGRFEFKSYSVLINGDIGELEFILPVEQIKNIKTKNIKTFDLTYNASTDIEIVVDNITYNLKSIAGKYPNSDSVIPDFLNTKTSENLAALNANYLISLLNLFKSTDRESHKVRIYQNDDKTPTVLYRDNRTFKIIAVCMPIRDIYR